MSFAAASLALTWTETEELSLLIPRFTATFMPTNRVFPQRLTSGEIINNTLLFSGYVCGRQGCDGRGGQNRDRRIPSVSYTRKILDNN